MATTARPPLPPLRPPSGSGGRRGTAPQQRVDRDLALERPHRLRPDVGRRLLVVAIGVGIVGYMAFRGVQYVRPSLIFSHPQADLDQSKSGRLPGPAAGDRDPHAHRDHDRDAAGRRRGHWIVEYGRPTWLARVVDSGIEIIAGTPDIVIALFGLVLFQQGIFGWMSFTAQDGAVFGRPS